MLNFLRFFSPHFIVNQLINRLIISLVIGLVPLVGLSQCVVLNEIMVNAAGGNDGTNDPQTAEWVELYNTCDVLVDLSCYVFTDGDFTVTFPPGTTIDANGFLTLGSNNSGIAVDINWATCGCSAGNNIGVFTNNNEQAILADSDGLIQSAIYWGAGQFPVNNVAPTILGCSNFNFSINNSSNANLVMAPSPGTTDGCTLARSCDGSGVWEVACGNQISAGVTNIDIGNYSFGASDTEICVGQCVDFSDLSLPASIGWSWQFSGANTATSDVLAPLNICYDTPGQYDVTLEITTACGVFLIDYPNYMDINEAPVPVIVFTDPLTFCEGGSATLSCDELGTYQWYLDGAVIPGATSDAYDATTSGIYSVNLTSGNCQNLSAGLPVVVTTVVVPDISPATDSSICEGETINISMPQVFDTYQWLLDGVEIPGATLQNYDASEMGSYTILVTETNCSDVSDPVAIEVVPYPNSTIVAAGNAVFCEGQNVTLSSAANYDSYLWELNGTAITGATSQQYIATIAGDYSLIVSNQNCEDESDATIVTVNPYPTLTLVTDEDIITCDAQAVLSANSNGTLQWLLGGALLMNANENMYVATLSGLYSVIATLNNGCDITSENINVSLNNVFEIDINSSADTACVGQSITLTASGNISDVSWSNGASGFSTEVMMTGEYIAFAGEGSCLVSDTTEIVFIELPQVDAGPDFVSSCDSYITLEGFGVGQLSWETNDALIAFGDTITVERPSKTTTYVLTADTLGCRSQDAVIVEVDCNSLYVPNSFTPDNDGVNDVFKVEALGLSLFKLSIYNRWGDLVFETDDPNKVWTGGAPNYFVPDGVYIWQIVALDGNNNSVLNEKHSRGIVTVFR